MTEHAVSHPHGTGAPAQPDPKVLVADLDGTLLGGNGDDRRRLHEALGHHRDITVVFATGRGLPSIREALRDPLLPRPRWIIADVGAGILDGTDLAPVRELQARQRAGWPGAAAVREALRRFPQLTYQEDVPQDGRCSFYLDPGRLTPSLLDAVAELDCSWQYSAGRYFDVLPRGASKGSATAALARAHSWPSSGILVAGDTLNDLSLFRLGTHGVIVGGAEPALLDEAPTGARILRSCRPGAGGVLEALERLGWVRAGHRLVVGYHRSPVHRTAQGWRRPTSPNGILPTLTGLFGAATPAVWTTSAVLDGQASAAALHDHATGLPLSFVPLDPAVWSGSFHRTAKEALWPVLMSQPDRMRFTDDSWAHYRMVNARFAAHIDAQAASGATVWLHDYNLWLVPGLLRRTRPDLRLGLFHHTPFPPPEVFRVLPAAAEVCASLACLDWAGFHTAAFARNFRRTLAAGPRTPRLGVHPLGIDREAVASLARSRLPHRRAAPGPLVLSVERLDYVKAPVEKVDAVDALLARRPDLRGHLRFRLVCPPPEPGVTAYDSTRRTLETRIGEVNRRWGTRHWQPVEHLPRSLPFSEVIDHYLAADVFWVASLQDGMNLTALEFVAAHAATGLTGVLVLSRHTGAATHLGPAALLTDPLTPGDLTDTLERALALTADERRTRLRRLADRPNDHPARWASRIIDDIGRSPVHPLPHLSTDRPRPRPGTTQPTR